MRHTKKPIAVLTDPCIHQSYEINHSEYTIAFSQKVALGWDTWSILANVFIAV